MVAGADEDRPGEVDHRTSSPAREPTRVAASRRNGTASVSTVPSWTKRLYGAVGDDADVIAIDLDREAVVEPPGAIRLGADDRPRILEDGLGELGLDAVADRADDPLVEGERAHGVTRSLMRTGTLVEPACGWRSRR